MGGSEIKSEINREWRRVGRERDRGGAGREIKREREIRREGENERNKETSFEGYLKSENTLDCKKSLR